MIQLMQSQRTRDGLLQPVNLTETERSRIPCVASVPAERHVTLAGGAAGRPAPVQPQPTVISSTDMKLKKLLAALLGLIIITSGKPAQAATHIWSGAVNSLWSNPDNWSSGGVPALFETPPLILDFPDAALNHQCINDIGASIFELSVDQIVFLGNNFVLSGLNGGTNLSLTGYVSTYLPFSLYSSGTNNTFDYSLNCYLGNTNVVYVTRGASLIMDGWFTGPGGLTFTGPGTCVLTWLPIRRSTSSILIGSEGKISPIRLTPARVLRCGGKRQTSESTTISLARAWVWTLYAGNGT